MLVALALAWFGLTLDRTLHTTDEGYLLRLGQRVAAGELPHRDFVEDYGPGVPLALGAVVGAGDGEILFVRRAIAGWKALAVVLGFLFARLLVPLPVAFGVGLLSIVYWGRASLNLNAPHAAVLTIPICMAAAFVLALALRRGRGAAPGSARQGPGSAVLLTVAGLLCGGSVLFKQSLGATNAVGLSLALYAAAVFGVDTPASAARPATAARSAPGPSLWLAAWLAGAIAILIPGAGYLGPVAYLVHFAPLHLLMAFAALGLWRRGSALTFSGFVRGRALPFVAGALAPLVGVALFYLASGHLGDLATGMFERPLRRRNYATPTITPPASIATFVAGVATMLAGAVLWVRGSGGGQSRRTALVASAIGAVLALLGVLVVPHSNPQLYSLKLLPLSAGNFDWVLHTAVVAAAALIVGPALARKRAGEAVDEDERRRLAALLPLFFFSAMLSFQVFPRGAHNAWMAHPAWMPLLGVVAYEPLRRSAPGLSTRRRAVLAALLMVLPVWLAWPVAARTWSRSSAPTRALALPKTGGMHVQRSSIARWHLAEVEALVEALEARPPGSLLLVGGDVLILYLSDRPPLRPEHEYALYNVVLDMLPLRELAELEDGGWVERLRSEPTAVVVRERDDSGRRVLAALPSLARFLDAQYEVEARFGPYELLTPRGAVRTGAAPGRRGSRSRAPRP